MEQQGPSRFKGVGPSQAKIVESYVRAFPGVDVDALTANLALATLSTTLVDSFESKIRSLGYELSRPRYTVVRMLYLSPEQVLRKSEIAEAMRVSGAYITQLLSALEADGWVERLRDRADSRVTHVRLTESGRTRCAVLVPAMLEHMIDTCRVLSDQEIDQLLSMIDRITKGSGAEPRAVSDSVKVPE